MRLYNTLTHSKEDFIPMQAGKVKMYACGPTVYNYFHLGNARPFVTFDTLRRFLEYTGYKVEFCQNFTDIDDRIIQRAKEEGITISELSERYIREYYIDADKLGILRPTYQPKATETIEAIVEMIGKLYDKGYAYDLSDGIYYDVSKFEDYGKLSHFHLDELMAGAGERTVAGEGEGKRNPGDFVLWKRKKGDEPSWSSPWGDGRPGWHIECSAMIRKHLGNTIDIHGGGQDLIFPHHENEIAQSEAANGEMLSRYWVHNAFVNINNEKMSKSTGNFFTIRDIVEKYSYRVIRFFILSSHYRMPINFSDDLLDAAETGLERIHESVVNLQFAGNSMERGSRDADTTATDELIQAVKCAKEEFVTVMEDDFNTADAVTAIFQLVRVANSSCANTAASPESLLGAADALIELCGVLGLDILGADEDESGIPTEVTELVEQRLLAKKNKDFAQADRIRDQISVLGYQIKDTTAGTQVLKV